MNKPTPMKGRGRNKIQRKLWLMKYQRDSKRIERNFDFSDDLEEIQVFETKPENENLGNFLKNKTEFKRYSIKNFFLSIILFFSKLMRAA